MRRALLAWGLFFVAAPGLAAELPSYAVNTRPAGELPGTLVIVGGGTMPASIRDEFLRLAGGKDAKLVVIPTASAGADKDGDRALTSWKSQVLAALTTSPMFPRDSGIRNCYTAALDGGCVSSLRQFVEQDVLPAMPVMVTAAADAGYNVISTDFPELGRWPGDRSFAQLVVATNRPG